MITDALIYVAGGIMGWLAGLLPESVLDFPSGEGFATWVGSRIAPADHVLPIEELVEFLVLYLSIWLPAAMVYTIVKFVYRHLPGIGKA